MLRSRAALHAPIPSLSGHAVFLLLVQLALLVAVARIGAELAKRIGLPAVVGELTAGIALGPQPVRSLLPERVRGRLPARTPQQFHLLDAFGTVGMSCCCC